MIWDRDYMKNPSDPEEGQETDFSSSAPQPFNLFAGLQEEQLPSSAVQTLVHKPSAPESNKPIVSGETVSRPNHALYWTIAVIACLVALILAFL
jgi:hypothetical protein